MLVLITAEQPTTGYLTACNRLLEQGLECLHLRMPGATREQYLWAIQHISPEHRYKLVICDHFDLVKLTGLGGVHLSEARREAWPQYVGQGRVSVSVHSVEELHTLGFAPTYALLSPVFDSVSKMGYEANPTLREHRDTLRDLPFPVVGLGGVTPDNMGELQRWGFAGGAVLGYIEEAWKAGEAVGQGEAYMCRALSRFAKPMALALGGHDPSSGAGITADALTMQAEGAYPLTLCTTLTAQHESHFERLQALPSDYLDENLSLLLSQHTPMAMKVGLSPSWQTVLHACRFCRERGVKHIVWDPVWAASAAKEQLHKRIGEAELREILASCTLVTPNIPEAKRLFGTSEVEQLRLMAQRYGCAILLKGGHRAMPTPDAEGDGSPEAQLLRDTLILPSGQRYDYLAPRMAAGKHGTGCRLSAAITARLAQGYDLPRACRLAHRALQTFLHSGEGLLAQGLGAPRRSCRRDLSQHPLQYITNGKQLSEILERAEQALQGGVRWIQLRMKEADSAERLSVALALKQKMQAYPEALLLIDDDVEVAIAADADGVHLGLLDMPIAEARQMLGEAKIIGGTCNRPEDLALRASEGADYVGCGPWRMTTTKKKLSPLLGREGMERLVRYNQSLPHPLPLYAIGGIELEDINKLMQIEVSGIALSGLIERSEQISQACENIINTLKQEKSI